MTVGKEILGEDFVEKLIEKIKIKGRLGQDNRVGVILPFMGLGDVYYAISALDYFNKKILAQKKLILISGSKYLNQIFSYFSHGNFDCEALSIRPSEHKLLHSVETSIFLKYKDFILHWSSNEEIYNILHNNTQFLTPLVFPRFPDFDANFYINNYNITPKKTFFIVPIANYIKPLPVYFWNCCAEIFKLLGYDVLFNVPDNIAKEYNGKNCFVPLKDAVGLVDLCGNIFAMRTGFIDFISTTKAKMIIFSTKHWISIDKVYHINNINNRIKTIYYDSSLDFEKFNPIEFVSNYVDEILSGYKYQLKIRENANNIYLKDEKKVPNIDGYNLNRGANIVKQRVENKITPICSCKYSFTIDQDTARGYKVDMKEVPYSCLRGVVRR